MEDWKKDNKEAINANKDRMKKIKSKAMKNLVLKVVPDLELRELNPPKRPLTGYFLFSMEVRPKLVLENPELKGAKAVGKISEMWKALS